MEALNLINRIEALVEASNRIPMTHKVIVDEGSLFDLIDQLRLSLPDDIQQAQALLQERESLLSDAYEQSRRILEDAEQKAREIVEMSDFVQLAQQRADEVLSDADLQSQQILREAQQRAAQQREEADAYALETLRRLDGQLVMLINAVRKGIDQLDPPHPPAAGPRSRG